MTQRVAAEILVDGEPVERGTPKVSFDLADDGKAWSGSFEVVHPQAMPYWGGRRVEVRLTNGETAPIRPHDVTWPLGRARHGDATGDRDAALRGAVVTVGFDGDGPPPPSLRR